MNYRSLFIGFICCIMASAAGFYINPIIHQSLLYHKFFGTSYCIEKQGFPLLQDATYPFSLLPFAYDYDSLEPHIDAATLEIHRTQHHQGAIDNLNKALKNYPEHQDKTLIYLLENLPALPEKLRVAVRTFGGSHFDHTLYFASMSPGGARMPEGALADLIIKTFGSFEAFKEVVETQAKALVGSGWVWLCVDKKNMLHVSSTVNYDVPFERGYYPLLVLDVWEHAYYLKYQNKRLNYVQSWWHVVNWRHVEELYIRKL